MPAQYKKVRVTTELLNEEPSAYFIFGDNAALQGNLGGSALRFHPRAIGFVTKKPPGTKPSECFHVDEYTKPFFEQIKQLSNIIKGNPDKKYYISRLGGGAANKYNIWQLLIKHNLEQEYEECGNVVFCWEKE